MLAEYLDPRLTDPDAARAMAAITRATAGDPPRHLGTIAQARANEPRASLLADESSVRSRDFTPPGLDVGVRLYTPASGLTTGVVVYLHGGGWALGSLDINDGVCRTLSRAANIAVVSVDYRLAPEHPFPAALDDAAAVLRWVADGCPGVAESLVGPIGVAGLSAGAALAAVLARRSRDGDAPAIVHQLLICPVLDRDFGRASYAENGDGLLLTTDDMKWFWSMYLPDETLAAHPDAVPAALADKAGLPPATLIVAGADPLRDEALEYAEGLRAAGVDADLLLVDGVMHAFPAFPQIASGLRVLEDAARLTARRFA